MRLPEVFADLFLAQYLTKAKICPQLLWAISLCISWVSPLLGKLMQGVKWTAPKFNCVPGLTRDVTFFQLLDCTNAQMIWPELLLSTSLTKALKSPQIVLCPSQETLFFFFSNHLFISSFHQLALEHRNFEAMIPLEFHSWRGHQHLLLDFSIYQISVCDALNSGVTIQNAMPSWASWNVCLTILRERFISQIISYIDWTGETGDLW